MDEKMKILKSLNIMVICVNILFSAGCGSKQHCETVKQLCLPMADKEQIMETAEDVLSRMSFSIAKSDAESGYIRTRPLRGAQWFEFWRKDNVGAENSTEANLHNIQRIVELSINPENEEFCVKCNVKVQRLSMFDSEPTRASDEYEIFLGKSSRLKKRELDSMQKSWIELGEDEKLSTKILRQIEKKIKNSQ
jgi:hypothetical protein